MATRTGSPQRASPILLFRAPGRTVAAAPQRTPTLCSTSPRNWQARATPTWNCSRRRVTAPRASDNRWCPLGAVAAASARDVSRPVQPSFERRAETGSELWSWRPISRRVQDLLRDSKTNHPVTRPWCGKVLLSELSHGHAAFCFLGVTENPQKCYNYVLTS